MQKNTTTINLTRATRDYLVSEAAALALTNSSYTESLIMTHAFANGYIPSVSELENLRCSFLVNGRSNVTGDFRNQILTFPTSAQITIIRFMYKMNLINDFKITTNRMANIFKKEEICYFALGKMGRSQQYVNDYINSFSLKISTIGPTTAADNEYLFFSNYQQFKVNKPYPLFTSLLSILALPNVTNVIKLHYTQLQVMAEAIDKI